MHQKLSNTESQDIPPPPTTWNGIAPRPHPPPFVYLRLLLLSTPPPASSSTTTTNTSSSSPPSRPNSGAPPIGRQDFPFSAKMEEEVSRLMKGGEIVWPNRIVLLPIIKSKPFEDICRRCCTSGRSHERRRGIRWGCEGRGRHSGVFQIR